MSGRYRTIALQAVGVAVLAAVVYFAFLRPSDPGDLFEIDAPGGGDGGSTVIDLDPDKKKNGSKNNEKGNGRSNGNDPHNGARKGADGARRGGDAPANRTLTPPGEDGGPGDDQYRDIVSVLLRQVGEPVRLREIDEP